MGNLVTNDGLSDLKRKIKNPKSKFEKKNLKPKIENPKSKFEQKLSKYKNRKYNLLFKSCLPKPFESSKMALTSISILLGIMMHMECDYVRGYVTCIIRIAHMTERFTFMVESQEVETQEEYNSIPSYCINAGNANLP